MTINQFFAMGGYGFYVWTAYLFAFVILITNFIVPLVKQKTVKHQIKAFYKSKNR